MKIKKIVPEGSVVHFTEDASTFYLDREETRELLDYSGSFPKERSCPDVVHLEMTNRCNKNCPYCYVDTEELSELTTNQWKDIIDELVQYPINQFTLGGGEPMMRSDVFELAQYIRDSERNLAMTTNGALLEDDKNLSLFDQINFSYHHNIEELIEPIEITKEYTKVGLNFILMQSTISKLREVVEITKKYDLELLIMTYKPVHGDWEQMISPGTVYSIAKELSEYGLRIAVDMMTCEKCTGQELFVDIGHKAEVYPCSFVRKSLGSLLDDTFDNIYSNKMELDCPYLW